MKPLTAPTAPTTLSTIWIAWQQRRLARRLRRSCGADLPAWATSELHFTPPQADWLHRSLCLWHRRALPARRGRDDTLTSLPQLAQALGGQGVRLQACRVVRPAAVRSGDVMLLSDAAARRLFGEHALGAGGLALVVQAGSQALRLIPALACGAVHCPVEQLQGLWPGWVLRSQAEPQAADHRRWVGAAA